MIEGDASGKDLEALRLGASGDGPAARRGAQQVVARDKLVAAQAAAEVEVVRPRDVLVEEAPDPDEARAALLVLLVLLRWRHALAALADAGKHSSHRECRQRGARVAVADGGAARNGLVLGGGRRSLVLGLEALGVDLQPRDDGSGLDLEGADVADPEGGARRAARVGGRAADVVALIDGRAVGEERERRHRAAVVLQRSEQRVLVDLVARAVEAALVEAVDVVAVGAPNLAAILEARVALAAADDRVLHVGRHGAAVEEIATVRATHRGPRGAHRVACDRGVQERLGVAAEESPTRRGSSGTGASAGSIQAVAADRDVGHRGRHVVVDATAEEGAATTRATPACGAVVAVRGRRGHRDLVAAEVEADPEYPAAPSGRSTVRIGRVGAEP